MKIIFFLSVAFLLSSTSFSQERECYPWKPRMLPYLQTQIQFYGLYQNTYKRGEISEEIRDFNIDILINNFKQSRSFVVKKRSCAPPKGISEIEKQAFLQWMDDTILAMSEGGKVESI